MKKMFLKFLYLKTCSTSKLFSPIQKTHEKERKKITISPAIFCFTQTLRKKPMTKKYHFSQKKYAATNYILHTNYYSRLANFKKTKNTLLLHEILP